MPVGEAEGEINLLMHYSHYSWNFLKDRFVLKCRITSLED